MIQHQQQEIVLLAGGITALVTLLLSIIIYEIRAMRKDLKECVPDRFCKIMMSEHEKRIEKLENRRKNQNNYFSRKGKN